MTASRLSRFILNIGIIGPMLFQINLCSKSGCEMEFGADSPRLEQGTVLFVCRSDPT